HSVCGCVQAYRRVGGSTGDASGSGSRAGGRERRPCVSPSCVTGSTKRTGSPRATSSTPPGGRGWSVWFRSSTTEMREYVSSKRLDGAHDPRPGTRTGGGGAVSRDPDGVRVRQRRRRRVFRCVGG